MTTTNIAGIYNSRLYLLTMQLIQAMDITDIAQ